MIWSSLSTLLVIWSSLSAFAVDLPEIEGVHEEAERQMAFAKKLGGLIYANDLAGLSVLLTVPEEVWMLDRIVDHPELRDDPGFQINGMVANRIENKRIAYPVSLPIYINDRFYQFQVTSNNGTYKVDLLFVKEQRQEDIRNQVRRFLLCKWSANWEGLLSLVEEEKSLPVQKDLKPWDLSEKQLFRMAIETPVVITEFSKERIVVRTPSENLEMTCRGSVILIKAYR